MRTEERENESMGVTISDFSLVSLSSPFDDCISE